MTEQQIVSLAIGLFGAIAGGLINYGVFRERFTRLMTDVAELKKDHMSRNTIENELLEIHRRIDRHSKESEERTKEFAKLLAEVARDVAELKGYMRGRFGEYIRENEK